MERLYAPWRMAYIKGDVVAPGPDTCIFCDKPASGRDHDKENYIVLRGEFCYVILNAFPYNTGHVMVLPYRHIASPVEMNREENIEMMELCAYFCSVLSDVFHPHGYNIGINVGSAAGAGIAAHLHLHIVPRWTGDSNFMPVIGDVRVLPATLDQVYTRITQALESRAVASDPPADAEG